MMKLTRLQQRALERALSNIKESLKVSVYPLNGTCEDEPIVFGVNWSCKGCSPYQDAEEYGKNLIKAAKMAQSLNYLELVYTYEGEDKCDREVFQKSVDRLVKEIEYPDFPEFIQAALGKVGK